MSLFAKMLSGSSLLNGLMAYYKLEEAVGTRIDSSGGNNHLTAINTPGNTSGIVGNGVLLVAANSQYLTGPISNHGVYSQITLSFWFNRANAATDILSVGWHGVLNNRFYSLVYVNGNIYGVCENGSSGYVVFASSAASTWHHLVMIFNGNLPIPGRISFYLDGVLQNASVAISPPPTFNISAAGDFRMGGDVTFGSSNGGVDECGVWNRVLTPIEIATLFGHGSPKTYPF